jgi:purine-cytosine permease-like protein
MLIAGVLCVCVAVLLAVLGLWSLARPVGADTAEQVMRSVAPPQLAAAVMLAAGGAVALAAPQGTALTVVCVCIVGAIGTVAAGSWQTARYALRREAASAGCGGACAACTLACH